MDFTLPLLWSLHGQQPVRETRSGETAPSTAACISGMGVLHRLSTKGATSKVSPGWSVMYCVMERADFSKTSLKTSSSFRLETVSLVSFVRFRIFGMRKGNKTGFFQNIEDRDPDIRIRGCRYSKSIDGLCAIVEDQLKMDPASGALFLFCGRRRDRIKALFHEPYGFVLIHKRLSVPGGYQWLGKQSEVRNLSCHR